MCDSVVGVESFAGSDKETNPMFKEYHGKWVWFILGTVVRGVCMLHASLIYHGEWV